MYSLKSQEQGLITLSPQHYLPIFVESFLIDHRFQALSSDTIELYTKKLQYFLRYCERQGLTLIHLSNTRSHWTRARSASQITGIARAERGCSYKLFRLTTSIPPKSSSGLNSPDDIRLKYI